MVGHISLHQRASQDILEACIKGNTHSQKILYDIFAPTMFGICLRYANDFHQAEDLLQEGFIKVFSKLDLYKNKGSFEGWMKRIFINTAIEHYRKNVKLNHLSVLQEAQAHTIESDALQNLVQQDLLEMIQRLPLGYRTVFNLYAIEGYNHREIGELLNISTGTSKSQLARARSALQKMVKASGLTQHNY